VKKKVRLDKIVGSDELYCMNPPLAEAYECTKSDCKNKKIIQL